MTYLSNSQDFYGHRWPTLTFDPGNLSIVIVIDLIVNK